MNSLAFPFLYDWRLNHTLYSNLWIYLRPQQRYDSCKITHNWNNRKKCIFSHFSLIRVFIVKWFFVSRHAIWLENKRQPITRTVNAIELEMNECAWQYFGFVAVHRYLNNFGCRMSYDWDQGPRLLSIFTFGILSGFTAFKTRWFVYYLKRFKLHKIKRKNFTAFLPGEMSVTRCWSRSLSVEQFIV